MSADVEQKVREIICAQLEVSPEQAKPEASFTDPYTLALPAICVAGTSPPFSGNDTFAKSSNVILIALSLFSGDILILSVIRFRRGLRRILRTRRLTIFFRRRWFRFAKLRHTQASIGINSRSRRRLDGRVVKGVDEKYLLPRKKNPGHHKS